MNTNVNVLTVMNSVLGDLMYAQVSDIGTDTSVPDMSAAISVVAELLKASNRIDKRSVRKAGGGWWVISNEDMKFLREVLACIKGA